MTLQFQKLPAPVTVQGAERHIGVEVEFADLTEEQAAKVLVETLGGSAECTVDNDWLVRGSEIGDIQVYLDTVYRTAEKSVLRDVGLKLGREVIPVELVTDPLAFDQLPVLDRALNALRDAGAKGSGDGWYYGFGVHLNIEVEGHSPADVLRPLLAYALIEDWMRVALPIDPSRTVLPWTDPYPTALVEELILLGVEPSAKALVETYTRHCADRNRGLDMLPVMKALWPTELEEAIGADKVSEINGRPTYHFRLPDSRLDEESWSLADEWDRWLLVEQIASRPQIVEELADAWLDSHGMITLSRQPWAERCGDILADYGLARGAE
ncbi:hypothetical protein HJ526_01845 [Donghicola sp. C2-DW-16]|uniref:Amidoligase enzyme n=1 Tax=Donghicola mangrovi TaxID=2729614 RepID=A0ABX2PAG7_9RHOB|nr:amidoligase family protein [Donghicola mangrovi]NVO26150.1 hypothetical protein [Donghicola mangrovi]